MGIARAHPSYGLLPATEGGMALARQKSPTFDTYDDFMNWESFQSAKHDLVEGEPVAMAGGSEGHSIIQVNICNAMQNKLGRGNPCRVFNSDMAVQTGVKSGRYPDATIDCGPRNPANRSAPKPTVVFEVLSPETQKDDRTVKLHEYSSVETIAHYVLVEQAEPLVHVYSRGDNGDFFIRPLEIKGLDSSFELPAVGISISMSEIYDGLDYAEHVRH
jgi:Uma2 family endonuclease